jgi:hypothetical protein
VTDTQFAVPAKPAPDQEGIVRDRWGRYVLPDPVTGKERSWTRATTWAKTASDTFKLHQWQERMVAKGLALRPDLAALVATTDDKKELNRICEDAKAAAGSKVGANLGTAVHNYTEQADLGVEMRSIGIPPSIAGDVASYVQSLSAHGLVPIRDMIERVIVNTKLGVAGRLDRILTNTYPIGSFREPGTMFIGDVKTAANIGYSWLEVATQLAIYANADYMWDLETKTYSPMPPLDLHDAIVMHVPVQQGYTDLYIIDIETGWRYAELAGEIRKARSDRSLARRLGETITVRPQLHAVKDDQPTELDIRASIDQATCREDLSRIWQEASNRGLWTKELEAHGMNRLADLRG